MSEFKLSTGALKTDLMSLYLTKAELYIVKADIATQILKLRIVDDSSVVSSISRSLGKASKKISNDISNINYIINSGNTICSKAKIAESTAMLEISGILDILNNIWPFNGNSVNVEAAESGGVIDAIFGELIVGGFLIGAINGLINGNSEAEYRELSGEGYEIDSVVFDDEGGYGGNQGSAKSKYYWDPVKCWDILDMIHKHYGKMNIFEAFKFTSALNNSGCGYTAMANSLFVEYEGREDEFKETFGFSMYKDGDLNYDEMIIALYSTAAKEGISVEEGSKYPGGTTDVSRKQIMEAYLADKNVDFKCEYNVNVTSENVQEIIENGGHIILGYRDKHLNMTDQNGVEHDYGDGGHAIMVTGVSEDGKLIVSSWGEKYYIDPSDLNSVESGDNVADTFEVFYYD